MSTVAVSASMCGMGQKLAGFAHGLKNTNPASPLSWNTISPCKEKFSRLLCGHNMYMQSQIITPHHPPTKICVRTCELFKTLLVNISVSLVGGVFVPSQWHQTHPLLSTSVCILKANILFFFCVQYQLLVHALSTPVDIGEIKKPLHYI